MIRRNATDPHLQNDGPFQQHRQARPGQPAADQSACEHQRVKKTGLDVRENRIAAICVRIPQSETVFTQLVAQNRDQRNLHAAKIPREGVCGAEQRFVEEQNYHRQQRQVDISGVRPRIPNTQSPTPLPVPYHNPLDLVRTSILAVLIGACLGTCLTPAFAQRELSGSAEARLALDRLNVVGSVLMIAAHPDDENTALLAYLARGRKVRTGYLSLTRGEGGQNLIGAEQGDALGIIRTQELLAARRIDGAEQFFTRAIDFGFTKTPQETFEKWGHEKILSDVVWVVRRFQPDVI